jgi:hypothetical protein
LLGAAGATVTEEGEATWAPSGATQAMERSEEARRRKARIGRWLAVKD